MAIILYEVLSFMKDDKFTDFNNPLPYIFGMFILASFLYNSYNYDKLLTVTIVSSFFALLLFYKGFFITILLSLFFIVAVINNMLYYGLDVNTTEKIRVESVKSYYVKGDISGRKVYLDIEKSDIKAGDIIIGKGELKREINTSKGILGEYKVDEYKILPPDLITLLYRRREEIYNKLEEKIGKRKAGLITSVSFGYSEALDAEDRNDMKQFGISHAIAVSGLHMALVYGVLKKIFGGKIAIFIALLYVLFTGASPSTVRAYIMIFIMSFALVVKRNYNSIAAISLAGILILLKKPFDLFNLGFVLSFLATIGISLFNKKLNYYLYKLPTYLRKTISVSIAAQILTIPVLIWIFNEVSLNFLIGNIFLLPIMNVLILLGNCILVAINIKGVFEYLLFLSYNTIKIIDNLMEFFWNFKIDIIYIGSTIAYFYCILIFVYYFYKKGHKRFIVLPILATIYLAIVMYSPIPKVRYYKEGAILITSKGQRVLIQTKAVVDKIKLKEITMVDKVYKDFYKVKIGEEISISKSGKNYILGVGKKEYLLLVNREKREFEYDIIDFSTGGLQQVIILNDKVISR